MNERTKYIGNLIGRNIREIDPHAHVILYGSRARGEERYDSDWDILILTDPPVNIQRERNFRNHLYDLELEVGEPFSMFVYSKEEWEKKQKITPFYMFVNKEGLDYESVKPLFGPVIELIETIETELFSVTPGVVFIFVTFCVRD